MKYNELSVTRNQRPTRKGRGISAGQGKTAGRGTKGQKARTGHNKMPLTFMGGQRAFMQAVPKLKGFKSIHAKAEVVYTDRLNDLSGDVDNFTLAVASLISSPYAKVKVVNRGGITAKIALKTQGASQSAIAVPLIVGVSLDFEGPTASAPTSALPFTPNIGSTATKRMTTPMPPSQFVRLLQKRMDISSDSISERMVEPAVVKPDMISKKHSAYESIAPERYIGRAPNAVMTIHVSVTTSTASFDPIFIPLRLRVERIAARETSSMRMIVFRNPAYDASSP